MHLIQIEAEVEIVIISLRRFHHFPIANPTPLGWQANGVRREPPGYREHRETLPTGSPFPGKGACYRSTFMLFV